MLFAVFELLRARMEGTDSGGRVLSRFSSPCGATVEVETHVVHDIFPFCYNVVQIILA